MRELILKELTQEEIDRIRKNPDFANWHSISLWSELPEDFVCEFSDRLIWRIVCQKPISEDFIRRFKDKVDWYYIFNYQILSENFLREFSSKINCWDQVSYRQKMSENFIREFQDQVNWEVVSRFQNLSREFCLEFYDKVNWLQLYRRNKLYKGYFNTASKAAKLHIALKYKDLRKYL